MKGGDFLIINGKTIDDSKLVIAKANFERFQAHSSKRGKLTFDKLLDLCTIDCNPLAVIAEAHGVTRQRMSRIYKLYIRGLLPGERGGRVRQRICTLKRLAVSAHEFPEGDILAFVAGEARRIGYDVKRLHAKGALDNQLVFYKMRIEIRGKLCLTSHLRIARTCNRSIRQYCPLSVTTRETYDFRIIVVDVPDYPRKIFVVPANVFRSEVPHYYVPLERHAEIYKNHYSLIDWWQYENAWHLIKA